MNKDLQSTISLAGSGKKVPAIKLIKENPELAALISKLNYSKQQSTYDAEGKRTIASPNALPFRAISSKISENISDTESMMQLLPEIELWSQILVSSILSPKDMVSTEIIFKSNNDFLPSNVTSAITNQIKEHLEKVYKIKPILPDILKDVLFLKGSHMVAVIPENALDQLINGQPKVVTESIHEFFGKDKFVNPQGFLGTSSVETSSRPNTALEALLVNTSNQQNIDREIKVNQASTGITVIDNTDVLKLPQLSERIRTQKINDLIPNRSLESISMTDRKLSSMIYKNHKANYSNFVSVPGSTATYRRSIGEPLIMKIPSEATIPVHIPGDPTKQIGFFILLDIDGNPVSKMTIDHQYGAITSRLTSTSSNNGSSDLQKSLIKRTEELMGTNTLNPNDFTNRVYVDYTVKAYNDLIEADLLNRLRNGVYGNAKLELASNQEIYRIMLARSLQNQNTQLLFIPAEMATYFALRFTDNGIGKSLLDEMKVLLSLRIILMFADTMSSIKNSIGRTGVAIKLDEADPDPSKTIEETIHEVTRSRQQLLPLGMNNPVDIVSWLQRAGYEFEFEGHPGLPDIKIDFSEKNSSYTKVDSDLSDNLRKISIMATGLNPETVDNGFNSEFATTVVANNILLSKRVLQIQEKFMPQVTNHIRQYLLSSQPLKDKIKNIIKENLSAIKEKLTVENYDEDQDENILVEQIFLDCSNTLELSLPSPNSITLTNQMDAFKNYMEALDECLNAYISDSFINETTAGEVANNITVFREVVKAYFLRNWLAENGMLSELSSITSKDENGEPMVDFFNEQSTHISALQVSLSKLLVKLQEPKEETNQELQDNGVSGEVTETSSDNETESSSEEEGGSEDELGDFNFDEDESGTEEESTEETEEKDSDTQEEPEKEESDSKDKEDK